MASRWLFGIAAAGLLTGLTAYAPAADAQGATYWPPPAQPVLVVPAPAPTAPLSVTRTERSIDANGFETNRVETYHRSDSVGQGYGTLSAVSNSSTQWVTTTAPTTTTTTYVAPSYVTPSTVWVTSPGPEMVTVSPVITSTRDEALDRH